MNAKIRLLLAAVCALWLGVSLSCQSSSGPSADQQGPQSLVLELSFDSDAKAPDSGRWSIRKDSGDVSVELVGERKYSATFEIPSPIGSDKLWLTLWTAGLKLVQVPYVWRDGAVVREDQGVVYDSATLAVVRAIQKPVGTDSQVAMGKGGAATLFARAVLSGDSLARFVPLRLPGGLDSQRVFDSTVALAARSGSSFKQILTTWTLGKDSAWLQMRVAELVASGVLFKTDSAKFFPPPPVRLKAPLAVVADLVAGGAEQSVSGEFVWDSGAVTVEANIWRGSDSVTERFQVFMVAAPGAKDTTWNLSKLVLKAREGIDTGTYQLQVVVSDPKGNSAKGQSRLHVVAAPPGAPRLVRRLPEHQEENVLPFDSAELRMEWVVRNPANFDDTTFRVDGAVPFKRNDSVWTASVAIAPDGREKTIAIRARSRSGEAISDYVKVVRLRDSAGPTIVWISPTSEVVVDFAVESFLVKLRATDPSGIDSVWIDGVAASLQDGSWQATVRLDPTGVVREIRATARDKAGNRSDSTIRIGRGKDNIRPTVVPRTASGVWPHDSVSATLSWTVTDNHQVGVVKIGDSLANRSGDAYGLRVPLKVGANRFVLVASDTSGNVRSDTVVLVRAAGVPVHKLEQRRYIGAMEDTVVAQEADSLEWSTDGATWTKFDGVLDVAKTGVYQVRAWPGPSSVASAYYRIDRAIPFAASRWSFFLVGDSLYATGENSFGQLGDGTKISKTSPTPIMAGIAKVGSPLSFSDVRFSVFLTTDGGLLAAGVSPKIARLTRPVGYTVDYPEYLNSPVPVQLMDSVRDFSVGYEFILAIKKDGSLWGFGDNSNGQLGIGKRSDNEYTRWKIADSVVSVAAGEGFGAFVKKDGGLFLMGSGRSVGWTPGDSVPKRRLDGVKSVSARAWSALAVMQNGQLWAIGRNGNGAFGDGTTTTTETFVQTATEVSVAFAGFNRNLYIGSNGRLMGAGSPGCMEYGKGGGWTEIAENAEHASLGGMISSRLFVPYDFLLFVQKNGALWGSGCAYNSVFGSTVSVDQKDPVRLQF